MAGFVEDRLALIEDLGHFLDTVSHGFFGGVAVELFVDGGHAFVEVGDLCLQFFQALYDEFVVHGLLGLGHKEGADSAPFLSGLWQAPHKMNAKSPRQSANFTAPLPLCVEFCQIQIERNASVKP